LNPQAVILIFPIFALMNLDRLKDLKKYTVGIAGCGGLGSNCAVALARVGIGKLILADYDVVEKSNLNRQYYFLDQVGEKKVHALQKNIYRINPDVLIETHITKLGPTEIKQIYNDCDVVVEAFDKKEMKQMLIETVLELWPVKPLVIGSGMAGWGNSNQLKVKKYENIYICGDGESEISESRLPLGPRVGIVANMQANVVMEILLGKDGLQLTVDTA